MSVGPQDVHDRNTGHYTCKVKPRGKIKLKWGHIKYRKEFAFLLFLSVNDIVF